MEQIIQEPAMVLIGLFIGWLLLMTLFVLAWAEHGRRRRAAAGINEELHLHGLDETSWREAASAVTALPRHPHGRAA